MIYSKKQKAAQSRDLQIFLQNILDQQINEDKVEQDLSGESVTVLQTPSKASEEDKGSFLKYIATNLQNLLQKIKEKFEIAKKQFCYPIYVVFGNNGNYTDTQNYTTTHNSNRTQIFKCMHTGYR